MRVAFSSSPPEWSSIPKLSSALCALPYSAVHPIPSARAAKRCVASVPCFSQAGFPALLSLSPLCLSCGSSLQIPLFWCLPSIRPSLSSQLLFLFFLKACSWSSTAATGLGPFFPPRPSISAYPQFHTVKAGIALLHKKASGVVHPVAFPFLPGSNLQYFCKSAHPRSQQ